MDTNNVLLDETIFVTVPQEQAVDVAALGYDVYVLRRPAVNCQPPQISLW